MVVEMPSSDQEASFVGALLAAPSSGTSLRAQQATPLRNIPSLMLFQQSPANLCSSVLEHGVINFSCSRLEHRITLKRFVALSLVFSNLLTFPRSNLLTSKPSNFLTFPTFSPYYYYWSIL